MTEVRHSANTSEPGMEDPLHAVSLRIIRALDLLTFGHVANPRAGAGTKRFYRESQKVYFHESTHTRGLHLHAVPAVDFGDGTLAEVDGIRTDDGLLGTEGFYRTEDNPAFDFDVRHVDELTEGEIDAFTVTYLPSRFQNLTVMRGFDLTERAVYSGPEVTKLGRFALLQRVAEGLEAERDAMLDVGIQRIIDAA